MPIDDLPAKSQSMPEAEVALRLTFWLLDCAGPISHADVAIDGAHVRIKAHQNAGRHVEELIVFDIRSFLTTNGFQQEESSDDWRGSYRREKQSLKIGSMMGFDVQVVCNNKKIKVECKGGPLQPKPGRSPIAILASAIGQVIISGSSEESEELWVAVPDSTSFERASKQIVKSEPFAKTGIKIALVSKTEVRLIQE